ncbi:hypothetical protein AB4Z25_18455 [Rhizobium sp. RAF36]|uniref:hypothetical protein n=1 Tax=Rhizobium sp. RAF36 TaxID=3233055 RepID=UPI003F9D9584
MPDNNNPANDADLFSRKAAADQLITGAVRVMLADGIPLPLIIDRLLSFAAVQSSVVDGPHKTAEAFREMANRIEAGALIGKALQ